jgi:hypothetical protein
MLTYVFFIILIITGYLTFVSPYLKKYKSVTTDKNLLENLALLEMCKRFDERSYEKGILCLKDFMSLYSNSFSNGSHDVLKKMKKRKHKTMYYFRRILFRLHNDIELSEQLEHCIESLNVVLDNYLVEASDRKGQYFFKMYS